METVNRVVVSGLVFGPVEFTEPDRGPAHARFCLSQEKPAGSRRVEHRFHCGKSEIKVSTFLKVDAR